MWKVTLLDKCIYLYLSSPITKLMSFSGTLNLGRLTGTKFAGFRGRTPGITKPLRVASSFLQKKKKKKMAIHCNQSTFGVIHFRRRIMKITIDPYLKPCNKNILSQLHKRIGQSDEQAMFFLCGKSPFTLLNFSW